MIGAPNPAAVIAGRNPAALIAALAAAGGQLVQIAPRVHATADVATFLTFKQSTRRGLPQCFGPIQYGPRKTQGVFVRRLPDLPR